MTLGLAERYPDELAALETLFGKERVRRVLPRLDEIHVYTETKWREYVRQLPDGCVRYLLIAESPPWSAEGQPQYLLDPGSRPRTLMGALSQAFGLYRNGRANGAQTVGKLAERGFLLADSTPFPMDYSSKRSTSRYDSLIRLTTRTYLQEKLRASSLAWSDELRIAFAVHRNALSIIEALPLLNLGSGQYSLSSEMIAVNEAGYPDATKLRTLWGLMGAAAG